MSLAEAARAAGILAGSGLLALRVALPPAPGARGPVETRSHGVGLLPIGAVAWFFVQLTRVLEDFLRERFDADVPDNLQARKVHTQVGGALEESPHWNGEVWRLHVTEAGERTVRLRARMSTDDAGTAWDLRCEVREHLLAWLRERHPERLPRVRAKLEGARPPDLPRAERTGPGAPTGQETKGTPNERGGTHRGPGAGTPLPHEPGGGDPRP